MTRILVQAANNPSVQRFAAALGTRVVQVVAEHVLDEMKKSRHP